MAAFHSPTLERPEKPIAHVETLLHSDKYVHALCPVKGPIHFLVPLF